MALWQAISSAIERAADRPFQIVSRQPLGGGSINRAYRIQSSDHHLFLKLNSADKLAMFEAEAAGLHELADVGAIRVPLPICWGSAGGQGWLVCEYIAFGCKTKDSDRLLGEQMAALHRRHAARFGWHRDNTIGSTPQYNGEMDGWIDFYRERRLRIQLELAAANGYRGSLQRKGERLMAALGSFFEGYSPEPSLLHGDLWGGNCSFDAQGRPVIYDPAIYYGDREVDLAMTELFGGFGSDFYTAYNAAWPVDSGYRVRKTLYNLYHILNHANLFGGGYASQAESMLDRLLAEVGQ